MASTITVENTSDRLGRNADSFGNSGQLLDVIVQRSKGTVGLISKHNDHFRSLSLDRPRRFGYYSHAEPCSMGQIRALPCSYVHIVPGTIDAQQWCAANLRDHQRFTAGASVKVAIKTLESHCDKRYPDIQILQAISSDSSQVDIEVNSSARRLVTRFDTLATVQDLVKFALHTIDTCTNRDEIAMRVAHQQPVLLSHNQLNEGLSSQMSEDCHKELSKGHVAAMASRASTIDWNKVSMLHIGHENFTLSCFGINGIVHGGIAVRRVEVASILGAQRHMSLVRKIGTTSVGVMCEDLIQEIAKITPRA